MTRTLALLLAACLSVLAAGCASAPPRAQQYAASPCDNGREATYDCQVKRYFDVQAP
jgi:hypothetical protein